MKHKVIILLALLLISSVLGIKLIASSSCAIKNPDVNLAICSRNTIWVPDNYTTVQGAINAANDGDIIHVRAGTYYERLVIKKSVSLIGENKSTTIIDGSAKGTVVRITANNARFSGFTVQKSGSGISWPDTGIRMYMGSDNTVDNNIVTNNDFGIRVDYSHRNTVFNNTVVSNTNIGISIDFGSTNNNVSNNIASQNYIDGICVRLGSDSNTVSRNTVALNTYEYSSYGIEVRDSSNNKVIDNNVTAHTFNIILEKDAPNTIITNNWLKNGFYGIAIISSSNCRAIGNFALNNTVGFYAGDSDGCVISSNTAINSSWYGLRLSDCIECTFVNNTIKDSFCGITMYHLIPCVGEPSNKTTGNNSIFNNNFINNTIQAYLTYKDELGYEPPNKWDNGYPSGGNYWSNYTGIDLDRDGIGNSPYIIDANNTDNYPLMGVFSSFNTSIGKPIDIVSNSTIEDFEYFKSNSTIKIHISNMTTGQTHGFCRVCIPHALMSEPYNITINGASPVYCNYTLYDNGTHRWIYFTYQHSTCEVVIEGTDTAPPIISVLSPENKTYSENNVALTFTVDEPTHWIGYSLNGQANVTITANTSLTSLIDGEYQVIIYANDTAGNMGTSNTVYLIVDTTPPNIMDVSQTPLPDSVLPEDEVKVSATVTDNISGVKQVTLNYTNGNGTWITVAMTNLGGNIWNATISAFPYGTNVTYVIIAEDIANNTVTTEEMEYELQYQVISEFVSAMILPLLIVLTLIMVKLGKRVRLIKY